MIFTDRKIDVFGTLGPSCEDPVILRKMFEEGMTGIRINLSHVMLADYADRISMVKDAGKQAGLTPKILIDLQGPEIRIGSFDGSVSLEKGADYTLGTGGIPLDLRILDKLHPDSEVLLDDGKILAKVKENNGDSVIISVERGGILTQRKSLSIKGVHVDLPALTDVDLLNLKEAPKLGITGVMQPFVRNRQDLIHVRQVLSDLGGKDIRLYAKIENLSGVEHSEDLVDYCDEIVIARGDLGNAMPLWELPAVQKKLSGICRKSSRPFMVVTQMLSSMENNPIPTRAEVSDIFNAVADGASSVMVTGETAVGRYPVEVIKYLNKTAGEAVKYNAG